MWGWKCEDLALKARGKTESRERVIAGSVARRGIYANGMESQR